MAARHSSTITAMANLSSYPAADAEPSVAPSFFCHNDVSIVQDLPQLASLVTCTMRHAHSSFFMFYFASANTHKRDPTVLNVALDARKTWNVVLWSYSSCAQCDYDDLHDSHRGRDRSRGSTDPVVKLPTAKRPPHHCQITHTHTPRNGPSQNPPVAIAVTFSQSVGTSASGGCRSSCFVDQLPAVCRCPRVATQTQ